MQSAGLKAYIEECQENLIGFPRMWLNNRGLFDSTIRKYMLGWDGQRNAVVIPYLNALMETRRVRYRNFDGDPKYIWDTGGEKGAHLFHVRATRKPYLWMAEGEFDAMILAQMGFPSVAVPGAKLFKPEWRYLFVYCKVLTIVFDPDEKGIEGANRVSSIMGPLPTQIRQVKLPHGLDVSELYKQDRAMLEELVK